MTISMPPGVAVANAANRDERHLHAAIPMGGCITNS
jgi:hypothetical protein